MNLRDIPSVDRLVSQAQADGFQYPRAALLEAVREAARQYRALSRDGAELGAPDTWILVLARSHLDAIFCPSLKGVVNATGVILHTNLGRAILCDEAIRAVYDTAWDSCNLELDLGTGRRGSRHAHTDALLRRLTGAEASLVVNNGAAAVLLMLDTLGRGREVIVSRGELVEIGGSFRLPDVVARSGAHLVEVGTTNKTRIRDYEDAIGAATGLLLKSHRSNFHVVGFAEDASLEDMVALGQRFGIPVAMDLGSGLLLDLAPYGFPDELTVPQSVAAGVGLVCFSGDKLLGGPQAGIIAGSAALVERCRRNPLIRALRVDKLTIAALEATFRAYLDPEQVFKTVPTLRMLTTSSDILVERATRVASSLSEMLGSAAHVAICEGQVEAGGGTLPGRQLPTWGVAVRPTQAAESAWESLLREGDPAVICRTRDGALLLDMRTLLQYDTEVLVELLLQSFRKLVST